MNHIVVYCNIRTAIREKQMPAMRNKQLDIEWHAVLQTATMRRMIQEDLDHCLRRICHEQTNKYPESHNSQEVIGTN